MRTTLIQKTTEFIDHAIKELDKKELYKKDLFELFHRHHFHHSWDDSRNDISVEQTRELILELEAMAIKSKDNEDSQPKSSDEVDPRYPVYSEIVEVIPIYKDGVSLERHKPIVNPSQIPRLLYLLKIPRYHEGMDIENHNNCGYHFHYGKINSKSNILERTNLLLTFNPIDSEPKEKEKAQENQPPLYFEYHAEGKTKLVDVESIGKNKRHPIYLVCLEIGKKRGLLNFKRPSKESRVFFDSQCLSV